MAVTAKLKYLRITPRKVRLVADLIRGKSVERAQTILNFSVKGGADPLLKLLKSAIASAKHNFQMDESNLYVAKIFVDEGPKYKRWMPRARGQASEIQKKTSHVTLVLDQVKETGLRKPGKEKRAEGPKEQIEKIEKVKGEKVTSRTRVPKFRPRVETKKLKIKGGIKRMFRRKAA